MQTELNELHASPNRSQAQDQLVAKLRTGDPTGLEELRRILGGGIWFLAARYLGPDGADQTAERILTSAAEAVCRSGPTGFQELVTLIRTLIRQQATGHAHAQAAIARTDQCSHDHRALSPESVRTMYHLLSLSHREREALIRFYLGSPMEQICRDLGLRVTAFRLLRVMARRRFRESADRAS